MSGSLDRLRQRETFVTRMRTPALVWLALICLLCAISAIGVFLPRGQWWVAELACLAVMVSIVIVFSMEMKRHQPIVRLFSLLGFFWVGILFSLIMLDYLTRG